MNNVINKEQINSFLNSWADGILAIGKCYLEKEDYIQRALNFIEKHYAFDNESVMFKPTFTQEKIFRNDKESALSYLLEVKCQKTQDSQSNLGNQLIYQRSIIL